jgi:beta-carotene 3-hydroxylase
MIQAHYVHHSKHTKAGCEAFSFLIALKKYEPESFSLKKDRQETQ